MMTTVEILNYFSNKQTYQFTDSLAEFLSFQTALNASYNYIVVNGVIYFTSDAEVNDPRAITVTEE
jgi:hypothetical protein